jgi:hypothetical protein
MGEAILWVIIFVIFGLAVIAFILGLTARGTKEAKEIEANEEKLNEINGWYTADMKRSYDKSVANAAKEKEIRRARLDSGACEAIALNRELSKVWEILDHAKTTEKISKTEYKIRINKALADLEQKYPNAIYFVKAYFEDYNEDHSVAHWDVARNSSRKAEEAYGNLLTLYTHIKSLI